MTSELHLKDNMDALGDKMSKLEQSVNEYQLESKAEKSQSLEQQLNALTSSHIETKAQLQRIETRQLRPMMDGADDLKNRTQSKAFRNYLVHGGEPGWEQKSMQGSEDSRGGHSVPPSLERHVHTRLEETSFMRKIARVTNISVDVFETLLGMSRMDVGWAQETDGHDETNTPELRKVRIPVHELYARPRATQRILDDASIDLESWLSDQVANQMSLTETQAFVKGDGEGKPRGFLAFDKTTNPEEHAVEEIKTGTDGSFPQEHGENCLIDLFHKLKPAYLTGAVWVMSRSAQAEVRKLRDPSNMHFLWQPALSKEQLPSLLGHPVYVTDAMPALIQGTASTSIAFGNFHEGYQIVDRQDIRLLRDPYSAKPYVEFYTTKRVGGDVINPEAIKVLSFKTSE
jgi:HK97 family phage major capsid protein